MNKEQKVIEKFSGRFNGDDGAVVGKWVYSKDLFAENSHFRSSWLSSKQIGYKAMIVNISDAIVMNAEPKFALIGLGLPQTMSLSEISNLKDGIKKACDEFGISIIGGDTIGSEKLLISVTIISRLRSKAIYRNGAKMGDLIAHTGKLKDSLKGLKILLNGGRLGSNSRFKKPILRNKFFYRAAKFVNSAMDISDGLGADLTKLCDASSCGVKFLKKLGEYEMKSGEEYEILFTFSPKNRVKIARIAEKTRTKINIIAKITKGKFKYNAKQHHF